VFVNSVQRCIFKCDGWSTLTDAHTGLFTSRTCINKTEFIFLDLITISTFTACCYKFKYQTTHALNIITHDHRDENECTNNMTQNYCNEAL